MARRLDRGRARRACRWSWSTSARSTTTTSWTTPRPAAPSRASTPAGATSRPSSPATSCWPGPPRSPPSLGTEVAGLLAATIGRLCEGQVLELQHAFDVDRTEDAYLRVDRRQDRVAARHGVPHRRHRRRPAPPSRSTRSPRSATATAWPSRSSTTCSTSSPPTSELGKPAGHDLVEGVYTLPVIRTLAAGGPAADRCGALLGRPLERDRAGQGPSPSSGPAARSRARSTPPGPSRRARPRRWSGWATPAGRRARRRLRPPARHRPRRRRVVSAPAPGPSDPIRPRSPQAGAGRRRWTGLFQPDLTGSAEATSRAETPDTTRRTAVLLGGC